MRMRRENYNNIIFDTDQDQTEGQSVWNIAILILTLDNIELNDNQYGELQQYQF